MPDPSTTRISLYKSKSDGSELVTYTQDIGQNWDKVDAAVGFAVCTAATRPSSPYSGKAIMQSDTTYSTYFSNGTSPASASWVEIPNSSAAYAGRLVTSFPGSTSTTSLVRLAQTGAAAANRALATRGSGDTVDHFFFDFDGKIQWGAGGSSAADTNLYRSGANVLATDDTLTVAGDLTVTGNVTAGGIGKILFARKTADTGRATASLTADPHLSVALAANAVYAVYGLLSYDTTDATNADLVMAVSIPASATSLVEALAQPNGASSTDGTVRTFTDATASSHGFGALGTGTPLGLILQGLVVTGASTGNFAVTWARSLAAGTLTLYTNSYIVLTRVA